MSEIELTKRAITPEELNASFAQRDRPKLTPSKRDIEADTFRMIGSFVQQRIEQATAPLKERIAALESKIANWKYCGTWTPGQYECGNHITLGGSTWVCLWQTTARPGTDSSWQLCCQRGKDGKDVPRQPTAPRTYGVTP